MFRIVLHNPGHSNGLQDVVKSDFLLGHRLLGMLRDPNLLSRREALDLIEQDIQFSIRFWHSELGGDSSLDFTLRSP